MPMNFEIVTDSSCNLVEDMIDEFGLHILPLTFMVDGEQYQSYLKGQHTDLKQFYTMMRDGKVITTSLPNLADSEALMRGLLEQGRDVLYLGFSSGLSGTYEAVELLVKQLAAEFPERKLRSVDTLAASGGEGLLVWHAVQRARGGASIDEVRDWVEQHKLNLAHWFTVDDLMFLFRGGRVSKTAAWAGTMLNIKPVMHVDDEGRLIPLEKVRGRKKSLHALVDHMEKTAIAPIGEVRDWVEENKLHLAHWFTVDDLMFLFRGGRVSKTAAWAGTMLNIKPVMHVDDEGHLIPLEKVRGRKKSLNALVDHMEKSAVQPIDQQMVFITHGDCLEEAEYVAEQVKERFGVKEVVINYVDPVIGAHSGPGTMALFFLADKR